MNIVQMQDRLKDMSDDYLAREVNEPTGSVPPYLALSELTRRNKMRAEASASPQPETTIAEEAVASSMGGIGALMPQGGQPMGGQNVQGFAEGGVIGPYHRERARDYRRIISELEAAGKPVPPEYYRMVTESENFGRGPQGISILPELDVPAAPPMPVDPAAFIDMQKKRDLARMGGIASAFPPASPPVYEQDPDFGPRMNVQAARERTGELANTSIPAAPPLPGPDPRPEGYTDMYRASRAMRDENLVGPMREIASAQDDGIGTQGQSLPLEWGRYAENDMQADFDGKRTARNRQNGPTIEVEDWTNAYRKKTGVDPTTGAPVPIDDDPDLFPPLPTPRPVSAGVMANDVGVPRGEGEFGIGALMPTDGRDFDEQETRLPSPSARQREAGGRSVSNGGNSPVVRENTSVPGDGTSYRAPQRAPSAGDAPGASMEGGIMDMFQKIREGRTDHLSGIEADIAKMREDVESSRESDKWMALAKAGFAIAGGQSPYFAANVGEGAQVGIEALEQSNKDYREAQMDFLSADARIAEARQATEDGDLDRATQVYRMYLDNRNSALDRAERGRIADQNYELGLAQIEASNKEPSEVRVLRALAGDPELQEIYKQINPSSDKSTGYILKSLGDIIADPMLDPDEKAKYRKIFDTIIGVSPGSGKTPISVNDLP